MNLDFQNQVDSCLAALEKEQPTLHKLRRVPMDMIAEAVEKELELPLSWWQKLWHRVKPDANVKTAILVIARRNI